jgi:riboflavin kinase/FMN adenylyltransferase
LSVILTFDRDPETVVKGAGAAPHLMDDHTRIDELAKCGVDVVLVIPFTPDLLGLSAERFLAEIVAPAVEVRSIHVGENFRFGARALGNLDTLYVWAVEADVDVHSHPLLTARGEVVSSTRIRSLISSGDVIAAAELLDRPHAVVGTVHPGRGAGRKLGVPTANLTPTPGAALPADGVYAGRAELPDGAEWPAAISVGTPPTFPDARDFFEVHLIGFDGELVGAELVIRFLERLRGQVAFRSVEELTAAIRADVARALEIAGHRHHVEPSVGSTLEYDDARLVDDPLALEAAERAVADMPDTDMAAYAHYDRSWVAVFGPIRLASLFTDGGASAALLTGPLTAAEIPFVWDPFPPSHAQTSRPDFNWLREFTLLVAPDRADDARALLPRAR